MNITPPKESFHLLCAAWRLFQRFSAESALSALSDECLCSLQVAGRRSCRTMQVAALATNTSPVGRFSVSDRSPQLYGYVSIRVSFRAQWMMMVQLQALFKNSDSCLLTVASLEKKPMFTTGTAVHRSWVMLSRKSQGGSGPPTTVRHRKTNSDRPHVIGK